MAQFQDLSNELVLNILDKVAPDDIESMSLASKCIYQLALPQLQEHRRLRKRYNKFENIVEYKPNNWGDPDGLLSDLLCKIVTDAKTGHYVKKIQLDLWNTSPRDGWKPDEIFENQLPAGRTRFQQKFKTNMEIIEEAIRAVEIIPTEEVDDWLDEIRSGNEDPLAALLLLYAPKLCSFRFVVPYNPQRPSYLLKTMQRVAEHRFSIKPYISHLKHIDLCFAEGWEYLDFVKASMCLPSLTSIETSTLFMDGRTHEASSAILPHASNVTDIAFRGGFVPQIVLSEILSGVKNLKSLTYDFFHLWRDNDYRPTFDSHALMTTLIINASHSLQYLRLGAEEIKTSQMAPVRGCHALREIVLVTNRCLAVEGSNIQDLLDALPGSIERIELRWHTKTGPDGIAKLREALVGLIRESKIQLPNLRTLAVSFREDEKVSEAIWDCLGSDETAQMNKMLSFEIQGPNSHGKIPAWIDNVCTCGQDCFADHPQ